MTKLEAYKKVIADKNINIHIDGIDWEGEADDEFMKDLEIIKQMIEVFNETAGKN